MAFALVGALTSCQHIQAQEHPDEAPGAPPGVGGGVAGLEPVRWELDNGLTVLVVEDRSAPVVALQVWVGAGSADEEDSESGLAHVHEHMLFKGTERRGVGEIAREVEASGGDINAYTSKDVTVYHITIASRFHEVGLDILADAMFHSSFDADELAKELEVVLEEYRRGRDSPERKIYEVLFDTAFGVHSYRRTTIGDKEIIENLERDDVLAFYRKWYVPRNLTLVVTGDVDAEALRPRIEELFGGVEDRPLPERPRPTEPAQEGLRVKVARGPFKKTLLYLGWPIPDVRDEAVPSIDTLAGVLGDGESSRLWRDIKAREELVHSIFTYAMTPRDPALFIIGAELDEDQVEATIEAALGQIREVRTAPVGPAELEKAIHSIESDFIYDKETVQGQARSLGFYETIARDWRFEPRYLEGMRKVTAESVQETARTYLRPDKLTAVVLLPDDSRPDLTDETLEVAVRKALEEKVADEADVRREDDFTVETFANGLTLVVRERPGVEVFSIAASFLGGTRVEPEGREGISGFVGRTVTRGTRNRGAEEIARATDELAGSLDGFSGRNSFGLRGHFLSRDLEAGLDLFADVLLHPTFPETEIDKERVDILHEIEVRDDNPGQKAFERTYDLVFSGHPAGKHPLGTAESAKAIHSADLGAFYEANARPSNCTIAVVGNVDADRVRAAIRSRLGDWEAPDHEPPEVPVVPARSGSVHEFTKREEKQQTHVSIAYPGVDLRDPDRYALEVLTTVLSNQGGRLFIELRDKRSLAYVVFAFNREVLDGGMVGGYIASSPDKARESLVALDEELQRIREKGITDTELERARLHLVGTFEIGLQASSGQAEGFSLYQRYGLGYEEFLAYPDRILAVTADDVARVARRYLDPSRQVVVIVGPEDVEPLDGSEVVPSPG